MMSTSLDQVLKPTKLTYNGIDRSAKKIATLVKIAKLSYQIQQIHDENVPPHVLHTPSGLLYKQYQIINYIIGQSRDLSKTKIKQCKQSVQNKGQKQVTSLTHLSQGTLTQCRNKQNQGIKIQQVLSLQRNNDPFITAQMHQKLFQLRISLFPLLQQLYKYLTGNQRTKKSKYNNLIKKIKQQIGKLNTYMRQNPQIFYGENNFLNIIIVCEMLMACKFVFQDNFRYYKFQLFLIYEKITHRKQFIQVHGRSDLCQIQYQPSQFLQDQPIQNNIKKKTMANDLIKISNSILGNQSDSKRNQLLYNYFKTTFSQIQSKKQYFPYFWLMFEDLNCSLVEIVQNIQQNPQINGPLKMKVLHNKIMDQLNIQIDYGILGLYQSQKDKKLIIRGLICLGSKSLQDFQLNFQKSQLIQVKIHKVNYLHDKQRKQVQNLWQHVVQNTTQQDITLTTIIHF